MFWKIGQKSHVPKTLKVRNFSNFEKNARFGPIFLSNYFIYQLFGNINWEAERNLQYQQITESSISVKETFGISNEGHLATVELENAVGGGVCGKQGRLVNSRFWHNAICRILWK